MSKSKEKDVDLSLRQVYEGQLSKYTNMVTGWQNRWFVLDPHTGMLEYFATENEKRQRPRSSMHLAGAVVVPSEEGNSYTFTVNAANSESFKLRAADAKERQHWITRLRVVAQAHTRVLAESHPPLASMSMIASVASGGTTKTGGGGSASPQPPTHKMLTCNLTVLDAFSSVRDYLRRVECEHQRLVHSIEELPSSGGGVTNIDTELLLLKATSQATVLCLEQCLAILHYQQQQPASRIQQLPPAPTFNSSGASPLLPRQPKAQTLYRNRKDSAVSALNDQTLAVEPSTAWTPPADNEEDYVVDDAELLCGKEALATNHDEHKSRTLLLLSQLKLGTELTRTHLPVFFCENRSLLQVLADAFRQPLLLLKIANESSAEQRMAKVVVWYFESLRSCQLEMAAARKPFNPILGEQFKCVWNVPDEKTGGTVAFRFVAEQVSHHPPVSAFHLECGQRAVRVYGHLSVKAKLMGMYAGTSLSGDLVLDLGPDQVSGRSAEKYELGYPTLYVRSILSEPWMEFGGKVHVNCAETQLTTGIVFHTKPFYGGKPHHVTAEIKGQGVVCRLVGDWNTQVELQWSSGMTEAIQLNGAWTPKLVRPLQWQAGNESLKLWSAVAQSLARADFQTAAEAKKYIEERQREGGDDVQPALFRRENETWTINQ